LIGIGFFPFYFFFSGADDCALSPCGRGHRKRLQQVVLGEGSTQNTTPHPALRATFSHKGRRKEELTPA
jgi:hypothetical protein